MTMASRWHLYDDHIRDSDWKKIVGIGISLFSIILDLLLMIISLHTQEEDGEGKTRLWRKLFLFYKLSATLPKQSIDM